MLHDMLCWAISADQVLLRNMAVSPARANAKKKVAIEGCGGASRETYE